MSHPMERMAAELASDCLQGEGASLRLVPPDREALAQIVRIAARDGRQVRVQAGGTWLRQAATPPGEPVVVIDLRALHGVLAHHEEDLVCTALAGTPLASLRRDLAARGQEPPFLLAREEQATIGGALSCAADGPWRSMHGHLSDRVLGVEVLLADGQFVRAGGRVVKNVTGYDLCRLVSGARGAFGIVTEITFEVAARPPEEAAWLLACEGPDAALAVARDLHAAEPTFAGLHVVAGDLMQELDLEDPAGVLVLARGHAPHVLALGEELKRRTTPRIRSTHRLERPPWPLLADPMPEAWTHLVASVRPSRIEETCRILDPWLPGPGRERERRLLIDARTGVLHLGRALGGPLTEEIEVGLGERLASVGAHVELPRDPGFHQRINRNFPASRVKGTALVQALRDRLDPDGMWSPGLLEELA